MNPEQEGEIATFPLGENIVYLLVATLVQETQGKMAATPRGRAEHPDPGSGLLVARLSHQNWT